MSTNSKIEWTDATWNFVRGCTRISDGCLHCYIDSTPPFRMARNFFDTPDVGGKTLISLHPDKLNDPLSWRAPRRVFVNSLSDLFHEDVPESLIAKAFAVMAATPQHSYQILTKRPARMRSLLNSSEFVGLVRREHDALTVRREIGSLGKEVTIPVAEFPGYLVSNHGNVYTAGGSDTCVWCSTELPEARTARRIYCSAKCRAEANYAHSLGRWKVPTDSMARLRPLEGEQGHQRVTLYRNGMRHRVLIHRLVLDAFVRSAVNGEQGCHRDGDPRNNALPNLRWGTQEDNWADRRRQGRHRSHAKLTDEQAAEIRDRGTRGESTRLIAAAYGVSDTQVRNIVTGKQWSQPTDDAFVWPLPSVWMGVSAENQQWADIRIPMLLETQAAVRFVSAEPLLGPVDLRRLSVRGRTVDALGGDVSDAAGVVFTGTPSVLDWVIVGGESGRRARAMDAAWVAAVVDQCATAHAQVFVKQLGSAWAQTQGAAHPKGGDWDEWPEALRVRRFPLHETWLAVA